MKLIFSRGHATLHLAVTVSRCVGTSVRDISKIASGFRVTAPAQPSVTCFLVMMGDARGDKARHSAKLTCAVGQAEPEASM